MANLQSEKTGRDNRVFMYTRVLAALIVPILLVAFVMLYFFSSRSGELFAWPIGPTMSAMMLGAAYAGGAYFFARVVLTKQFHTVSLGFIPVSFFAGYLGIATLLHWDVFTPGHISFILWVILYTTLPIIIAIVWLLNRQTDPGTPDENYPPIPLNVRRALGVIGVILTVVSVLFMLAPDLMIPTWPWRLSPLTSRVMGALFVLPGLVGINIWLDGRWLATRFILQSQITSIGLILLAAVIAWNDINWGLITAYTFVGGMGVFGLCLVALYFWMERQKTG